MAAFGFTESQLTAFRTAFGRFDQGTGLVRRPAADQLFDDVRETAELGQSDMSDFVELFESISKDGACGLREFVGILDTMKNNSRAGTRRMPRDAQRNGLRKPSLQNMAGQFKRGLTNFFGVSDEHQARWQHTIEQRTSRDGGIVMADGGTGTLVRLGSTINSSLRRLSRPGSVDPVPGANEGRGSSSSGNTSGPSSPQLARKTSRVGFHHLGNLAEEADTEYDTIPDLSLPQEIPMQRIASPPAAPAAPAAPPLLVRATPTAAARSPAATPAATAPQPAQHPAAYLGASESSLALAAAGVTEEEFLRLQEDELRFYAQRDAEIAAQAAALDQFAKRRELEKAATVGPSRAGPRPAMVVDTFDFSVPDAQTPSVPPPPRPDRSRTGSPVHFPGTPARGSPSPHSDVVQLGEGLPPPIPDRRSPAPDTRADAVLLGVPGQSRSRPASTVGPSASPARSPRPVSAVIPASWRGPEAPVFPNIRAAEMDGDVTVLRPASRDGSRPRSAAAGPAGQSPLRDPELEIRTLSVGGGRSTRGQRRQPRPAVASAFGAGSGGQQANAAPVSDFYAAALAASGIAVDAAVAQRAQSRPPAPVDYLAEDWFASDDVSGPPPAYTESDIIVSAASAGAFSMAASRSSNNNNNNNNNNNRGSSSSSSSRRPRGRASRIMPEHQRSWSRLDTLVKDQLRAMPVYKPWFTRFIIAIQLIMLIAELGKAGVAPIAFNIEVETANKAWFVGVRTYSRNSSANFWIGPDTKFLINFGAKYTPCIRQDAGIINALANQTIQEQSYVCCQRLGTPNVCGRMAPATCSPSIGTYTVDRVCSTVPNCTDIVLHPCTYGYLGTCELLTSDACDFLDGYYHEDKELCSEIEPMGDLCSHVGLQHRDDPAQWYRFISPIFLHVGIIHFIFVAIFENSVVGQVERSAGWLRTALIFFISGIGGDIISAIFVPNQPTVGGTGALFGFLGVLFVELFQSWQLCRRPVVELIKLILLVVIALVIGLLPWVDNWAHIGGFFFGVVAGIIFLPYIVFGKWDQRRKRILLVVCIPLLIMMFIASLVVFYALNVPNFCSWCRYADCVPFTPDFCTSQDLF
ncbi:hypothetical protein CAOG_00981 [Capsaspora owczarzaki ATCC 30864]|uniref:Peptidase S54 rhomboid domain-containing protein n=1 Tax=Capsaspora owczarzaki (strain ATCC 30864) TaxID=595528 RepID=A0A0D2VHW5_CAPO3|nr:hypothetical protein CAOG_00981 [Capsaspora owczarzaki ATCC 30864]KJE89532.1 hypothetical protein CAOG_000981 [Capsaspora owczarzaki ATCC 30864]|eukprot:XP_004365852.1 hypothetical protein CAOG_00981 [Capsaspora owczarzaki ATCC 30864]